jgi:hypothetical protein
VAKTYNLPRSHRNPGTRFECWCHRPRIFWVHFHRWPRISDLALAGIVQRESNRRNVIVVIIVRKGEIVSDKDATVRFAKTLLANMTYA